MARGRGIAFLMRCSGWVLCLAIANGASLARAQAAQPGDDVAFFEAKIRPVLVEKCVGCHGAKKQEMGLRLDTVDAVRRGGDAGPVVVPGNPEESPLIEALQHSGPVKMPPSSRLPDPVIRDFAAWVKAGAVWPATPPDAPAAPSAADHWAFQPVRKPSLPAISRPGWASTPVDLFLGARLDAAGLEPSVPADRRTLLRRLSFDLTGLPPSPVEMTAFLADPAPDELAWARQVDRVLASPRYGERWGRHWLDVARYADTKGYVFLEDASYPWAWTYRDYVIAALNEDRPYDRFVTEQLAADLRGPDADPRDLRALGFLTVGGRFMNNVHDVIDDRIDVVSRGLMGLTVGCARCHDHKFDPVSQADYYAVYGIFASSAEPDPLPLYEPPPDTAAYRAFVRELEAREAKLAEFIRAKRVELETGAQRRVAEYLLAAHRLRSKPATEEFMQIADGPDLNPTILGRWQTYLDRARREHHPALAAWLAFEEVPDAAFAAEAAAKLEVLAQAAPEKAINPVVLAALRARPLVDRADLARRLAGVLNQTEAIWQDYRRRTELEGRPAVALPDPAREQLRLVFHSLDAPSDIALLPYGNLALLPDRPSQEELKKLQGAVEQWHKTGPGAPARAMVLTDREPAVEPRVFLRGNPNRPGSPVARRAPRLVTGGTDAPGAHGSGRLELARAVVDRANPLTARVLVNRVWMHHFGSPLVGTPSDFGLRGEPPTHPELLDWLAASFVEDGYQLKALHRTILLSSAYRQASQPRSEAEAVDPENRLLWRTNRRRLDLESLRDAMLAAAGRLDDRIGGPSFASLVDPATPRRSLYGSIDRLNLPGLFRTFDFPDPTTSSPRRDQTTVAPQALFLMNHPFAAEMARSTLQAAGEPSLEPDARRDALFTRLFQRPPDPEERTLARRFLDAEPDREAGWQRLAHALMLTNEFVFVE